MQSDTVKQIKQSFRRYMNGVAAASMREKGLQYKVNWGISLPNLRDIASNYTPDVALAQQLWSEQSRECRILATMLMPPLCLNEDVAKQWVDGVDTVELAEQLSFNLLQHIPFGLDVAKESLSSQNPMAQLCAIHLLSRLLSTKKVEPKDIDQSTKQTVDKLQSSNNLSLAHAAFNCMSRLLDE